MSERDDVPGTLDYRRRLDAKRSRLRPDPAEVIARAQKMRSLAEEPPSDFDDSAAGLDPRYESELAENQSQRQDGLEPYIEAYRERLDQARERLSPTPPHVRSRASVWIAMAVAATVAALGWGFGPRLAARWNTTSVRPMAASSARTRANSMSAPSRGGRPQPARPESGSRSATPDEPPANPEPEPDIETAPPDDTSRPDEIRPSSNPIDDSAPMNEHIVSVRQSERDLQRRLRELDRRAQARWRRGDLAGAQALFRSIVRQGGRSALAELAHGELFALIRQRGGSMTRAWRAYLRRFPRGRYAMDARAGLCEHAEGAAQERCWSRYRRDFPKGTHAPELP